MSAADLVLWIGIPYAAIAVFAAGHVWRYRRDQFGWTSRSTQLLERRLLRVGSLLFHFGLLAVIGGHVLGLLVPKALTEGIGVSESLYHRVSVGAGTAAGLAMTAGLLVLAYRRLRIPRVAITTRPSDRVVYVLLGAVVATGMYATVGENLIGGGYDYRETVAPWFRSLFAAQPEAHLIAAAPLVYQLHALAAWLLFAAWPFTRLVHAWSVPLSYLRRAPVVYRQPVPGHAPAAWRVARGGAPEAGGNGAVPAAAGSEAEGR